MFVNKSPQMIYRSRSLLVKQFLLRTPWLCLRIAGEAVVFLITVVSIAIHPTVDGKEGIEGTPALLKAITV